MGEPQHTGGHGVPPSKICVDCGADCAGKPRVKDRHGRYLCKACHDARAANQSRPPQASPTPTPVPPPPPAAPDDHAPIKIDLESDAADNDLIFELAAPAPLEPEAAEPRPATCPVCFIHILPYEGVCNTCGYRPDLGIRSSRKIEKAKGPDGERTVLCQKCGYDMGSSTSLTCSECGARYDFSPQKRDRELSQRTLRNEILTPIIAGGVGLLVGGLIDAFYVQEPINIAIEVGVTLFANLPIATITLWLMCLTFFGFNAPTWLNAIRLLGIFFVVYGVTSAAGWLQAQILIPVCSFPLSLIGPVTHIWLVTKWIELDLPDAIIYGIVSWFIGAMIWLGVIFYFMP